ncbi:MAG: hypothetical protein QNJ91_07010 [Gammaproteobacteria bacterium]|nr:hypothetical protein [Gammaproteobacteria bacterium]
MTHTTPYLATPWTQYLDVVGSELFLRYRKRLREPGISWQVWRDYPALSLPDVLVRVHAARQIVRNGDGFAALAAIRAGRWRPVTARPAGATPRRDDPASRALVGIGRGLFVLFCVLSMSAAVAATVVGAR